MLAAAGFEHRVLVWEIDHNNLDVSCQRYKWNLEVPHDRTSHFPITLTQFDASGDRLAVVSFRTVLVWDLHAIGEVDGDSDSDSDSDVGSKDSNRDRDSDDSEPELEERPQIIFNIKHNEPSAREQDGILAMGFTPGGDRVVTLLRKVLRLWDVATEQCMLVLSQDLFYEDMDRTSLIGIIPDSRPDEIGVLFLTNRTICCWRVADTNHEAGVTLLDTTVWDHDLNTNITKISQSTDRELVVSVSLSSPSIIVWNVRSQQPVFGPFDFEDLILSVDFVLDNKQLMIQTGGNHLVLMELESDGCWCLQDEKRYNVAGAYCNINGDSRWYALAAGEMENVIYLIDIEEDSRVGIILPPSHVSLTVASFSFHVGSVILL
jgi:hypothetical protein